MNVVMIGAGLMGPQIGCEYALAGHVVTYVARSPDVSTARIAEAFSLAAKASPSDAAVVERARHRTELVQTIADAPEVADLVVESIVESFDAKAAVLTDAANRWPGAILASNTSSLSITALGAACVAPERIV